MTEHIVGFGSDPEAFIKVFQASFADSEGEDEGRVIETLCRDLLDTTPSDDIFTFTALEDEAIVGGIMFTRITYFEDDKTIFLLFPVAIRTDRQGRGIGEALLRFGLEYLTAQGIDVALTYGNPAYYAKVGFRQISPEIAQPPFKLSQPHGWLGQSLTDEPLSALRGPSKCVPAFDDPAHW
ncbi:MAG: N-acetyltransferase [Pseudomonadota bacterium]